MLGEIGVAEEREVKWLESWASSDEEEVLVGLGAFRLSAMAAKRWVCQALLLYKQNNCKLNITLSGDCTTYTTSFLPSLRSFC